MEKQTQISVVVCVYNTKEYLRECLDSIVMQSYSGIQIVLVDDGSTDGSEKICDEYAAKDARITVVHQKNAGLVCARQVGARVAEGKYIYYVDCDDWIELELVQGFVDVLTTHNVDMIRVGVKWEYGDGTSRIDREPVPDGLYLRENIRKTMVPQIILTDKFLERQQLTFWHYLVKRELLLKNQKYVPLQIGLMEDVVCIYPCILDAKSIYVKSDIFYHYRQRSNSMKWRKDPKEYENLKLAYRRLHQRFQQEPEASMLQEELKFLMVSLFLVAVEEMDYGDSLFPYRNFPEGSRVVVYGAGMFGNRVISMLQKDQYADVVAWVDKNYENYRRQGLQVESPEILEHAEYDYVVLAVLRADTRGMIAKDLIARGIFAEKIIDIDLQKIKDFSIPTDFYG